MDESEEERDWIRKSQLGDHAAFEALIRRYQRMIHVLTFRMTGSVSDAEDLAQETFIKAFQHIDGFRTSSKFSSWIGQIAINLCLNWKRRKQLHESIRERLAPVNPGSEFSEDLSLEVRDALQRLDPKQRAAIVLTVYDELSHGEAAKILGCSETTVSWRVFMARRNLKKWLQPFVRSTEGRP